MVHTDGKRTKRRFGPTKADRRRAERAAEEVNHRLALGQYEPLRREPEPIPFDSFAEAWLRTEVLLPTERQAGDHLAPGTARSYASHVRVHLVPHFAAANLRRIDTEQVQAFYDRCIEAGRPRSPRTIEMVITTLGVMLAHAKASGIVVGNAVREWKASRRRPGRRRSAATKTVTRDMVLTAEEMARLLGAARHHAHGYYALFLFLTDTGARLGEATALRWTDVDLDAGTARIERSFSSGRYLGLTKTGGQRTVELSSRLREALAATRPDLYPEDALAFPNAEGGFIDPTNFRRRVFDRVVRKALGSGHRRVTPHTLRHTFASLHLSRGTNLFWVQYTGGWRSPQVLLDTYAHFLPTELQGFADALTAPDGTMRHRKEPASAGTGRPLAGTPVRSRPSVVSAPGIEPGTGGLRVRCSAS